MSLFRQVLLLAAFTPFTTSAPVQPAEYVTDVTSAATGTADGSCSYWLDNISHSGVAAFNSDSSYKTYRNVKDYGAKGDGTTDDTDAINSAISDGNRSMNASTTTTLAVVYFPEGTYILSSSILDAYYTQLIGNPNCMPVLKATSDFKGFGIIDGDPYGSSGNLNVGSTNVFFRQVNNFVFDTTAIPAEQGATGIHWPTAQATSLQNCVFKMSSDDGTQHQGVFIENGSGGFASDLIFYGGLYGMNQGNQQFTMRNLTFHNSVVAISQIWDWGWTYSGLNINDCKVGLNVSSGGPQDLTAASVTVIDSVFNNVETGILTAYSADSAPQGAGALILENVQFNNVKSSIADLAGNVVLQADNVEAFAQGNQYLPSPKGKVQGTLAGAPRAQSLLGGSNGGFYVKSKPQYETLAATDILTIRSFGAKGNGAADDTAAVQNAINTAAQQNKLLLVDAGTYKLTSTVKIPAGSRITGEGFSTFMSSGDCFADMNNPQVVLQVGDYGDSGRVELSNLLVSTQSDSTSGKGQGGAILVQWNLASDPTDPSGLWNVHARIGGFDGSNQQVSNCAKNPNSTLTATDINEECVTSFLTMHVTASAQGLYMENNWLWVADHDLDAPLDTNGAQVSLFAGRGLLVETQGPMWLWGTAVEHHAKYQYQFYGASEIFMGQIQTETAYYQPNPNNVLPFPAIESIFDPDFTAVTNTINATIPDKNGFGLRVINSKDVFVYGAGLYSFFNNWSTHCSDQGSDAGCQLRILEVENSTMWLYDLHTVGVNQMITLDGNDIAPWSNNNASFTTEVAVFRTG